MAQSIKLNNSLYWDLSGIHGADIYNGTLSLPAGGTLTLNFTSNSQARGFFVVVPNGLEKSGFGIYGFGSNSSSGVIRDIVASATMTINNTSFTPKVVSSNQYAVIVMWFSRAPLNYTIS